ncbi:outer membrane protein assembly factor BamA [Roseibacillus ishigakijimensis]|uniref:Outer membrane protein assembly factor BamA n=2 Tax=Roseibacillus ishigakijimensis TaxID=454146 RepID=A0A934RTZ4_9BACT|nr:outer membrane protein assembly factor BamA [Roseibacillus ishigakijimensis]
MILSPQVRAQDFLEEPEVKVTEVVFRYNGPKSVAESRLRSFTETKVGQNFDAGVVDEDVKRLYESGLVQDVQVLGEEIDGGVKVIFEVVTQGSIDTVGFEGNTVFSDGKLAKEIKMSAGEILSDAKILAARRNLQDYYRGYGYPDVTVTHRLQDEGDGVTALIFLINEGVKSEVRKILFEGNQAFSDVELRREMETKQKGIFSFITKSGRIDNQQLQRDLEAVRGFYQNNGYLRAEIISADRVAVRDERVDLVINVDEGGKYLINQIQFGPMTVFKPEELTPALSLIAGDPYSAKKVNDDRRAIRSYYGSRGYADANVTAEVKDAGAGLVNIIYRVSEGKRFKVGRVNIVGNTKTKDRVIRQEVPMKPGEYFNSVEVETTQKRLENLRYFNGVQVTGESSSRAGYRDLNIAVQEGKTGEVNFGAGFSSIDSIVGYINLEQRNFDIRNPWKFTGGGQRFSAQLKLGSERQDFKVSLVEPWFLGRRLSLGGELYYQNRYFLSPEYDQLNLGGAIFLRKAIGRRSYIRGEYRLENIELDVDSDSSPAFLAEDGEYVRSALGVSYVYDSRDSIVMPRKGHKFDAGVTLGIGGDVETYTFEMAGSKHWGLPLDMIFNLSGSLATVDSYGDGDVPIFDRLFLGGQRDLRGFEYRDLGERDSEGALATDEALGGQTSGYLSAEVTFPIFENVRGAGFFDAGFVNVEAWDFAPEDIYADAGMGLRLDIPGIGPLALDYAIPVVVPGEDDEADKGGQFNFYINYQY